MALAAVLSARNHARTMIRDDPVLHQLRATATRPPVAPPDAGLQTPSLVLFVGTAVRPDRALADALSQSGLRCAAVSDLTTAHEACANLQFDAVVVDAAALAPSLALGLSRLQPQAGCPVLVVADSPSEIDEIIALEHGASDYLALPLSPRLLRAHLVALMRGRLTAEPAADASAEISRSGQWLLDPMLRELRWSGNTVALTEGQFNILRCLASQAGRVVPRAELEARASGPDSTLTSRSIDVYVHRLRRRLAEAGVKVFDIQCLRGRGYRLCERSAEAAFPLVS